MNVMQFINDFNFVKDGAKLRLIIYRFKFLMRIFNENFTIPTWFVVVCISVN